RATGTVHLYGKEINDETYAICKSDMMIKGNSPENIRNGSTLSVDEFAGQNFDFMLSNPPYGKSWSSEQKYIKDGKDVIDPRFLVKLQNYWQEENTEDATPRSSDGQLLFLMEMVSKMKPHHISPYGSRIASVHNGSSLFTGDAGGGESNIRRHIIENDLLEAIIQMPNNLFYNTGITTYIWLLSNNKAEARRDRVQLIDASQLYRKLRKNLGNKNCEFAPGHIREIMEVYRSMDTVERQGDEGIASQVFDNADFGYYKVTIERPKRLKAQFTDQRIEALRFDKRLREPMQYAWDTWGEEVYTSLESLEAPLLAWCEEQELNLNTKQRRQLLQPKTWQEPRQLVAHAYQMQEELGADMYTDANELSNLIDNVIKLSAREKKMILDAVSWYHPEAQKVVKKRHKLKGDKRDKLLQQLDCSAEQLPHYGYYPTGKAGEYIEYETESDLRDTENVPLKEEIYPYFLREVLPHVPEAWIKGDGHRIGYEISFNKYFYRHQPLRSLQDVTADILHLEQESEGLIKDILALD
ncbi:MAG: N-6 DNA methylase, partial [Cyclobacteriaceae bacterium]